MQAFVHLALFTLLFVISATSAGASNSPTTSSTLTTPEGASTSTLAPASSTTPAGDNTSTPAPSTPTTPEGASTSTLAPASSTTPAGDNTSTPAPSTPTTPEGASTSTLAPASSTTPAGDNTSTPAPSTPTTPEGANTSTPTPATSTTPAGANNTTPAPASTTAPTDLCQDDSCDGGSYCVNLHNTHFCQCILGYYYNSSSCKKGKVFPGIIQVKTSDTSGLKNETSINYENLYMEVNKFFKDAFANSDYGQTVIQQVSTSASARSQMRAGDEVVNVTVVNLFAADTKENETTISDKIQGAISSNPNIENYANIDRCEFYGCVKENDCSDGFQCECQAGYERPTPYTATCLPLSRKCPYACKSTPKTQCLVKDDGSPECVCLAGYRMDDHEKCQVCAFGYNGVNCEDNFQLILTIVGAIAGILILSMVIALIFMRSKKRKDVEEQNLIENDFQNLKLQQRAGFSFPAEGTIFPKISTSFSRDGGMQNPYANSRGIPRPDY
ncbi:mucin-13 [Artibeus jamaicensis]|uniref:mucin-13 n=1 Tax=Artibeus jamaicensis TaxID=9417 RepID=UPI00235AABEF|nr:mucin-13 [Artibeus jamaicensis]